MATYTPTGMFATPHKVRAMMADCPKVRELLNVNSDSDALKRIHTYGEAVYESNAPVLACPSVMIRDSDVQFRTDPMGSIVDVDQRTIETWIECYVPAALSLESITDEHAWVNDQFSEVVRECLERTGQGFVHVVNPAYEGAQRKPDDMRGDDRLDPQPELSVWSGLINWEVP